MNAILLETLIIFLLLVINGIFAMSEIAVVSSRKPRLQQRAEDGEKGAQAALALSESPGRFLSTVQIGISLVGVLAGAFGGATLSEKLAELLARVPRLAPYADGIALFIVVLLITYFSLVIGELIPKRVAMNNPEQIATRIARPMNMLSRLTAPLGSLLTFSTEVGIRLLGIRPSGEPQVTEDEVRVMVEEGTRVGVFEAVEQNMIEGIFRLSDRRVDAILTPRTEIVWLDLEEPFAENLRRVLASEHSSFPVGQGSLDNIQGVLRSRDLLGALAAQTDEIDLRALVQPPVLVLESTPAFNLLEEFRRSRQHMALVIDEYGGLLGLVTLSDLMTSIVGEMPGAGEHSGLQVTRREDGSWLMDGLLPVDELKEILDIDHLPAEERVGYQTLGGFVMSQLGSVPNPGQYFTCCGYRFEVVDMDGRRVDKVLVLSELANADKP
jgi:putative hemolysin